MKSKLIEMGTNMVPWKNEWNIRYIREHDYVVIFDANSHPAQDYFGRMIPIWVHNLYLFWVQDHWKFVKINECLTTLMQEMSLDYHCMGSSTHALFSFNGMNIMENKFLE
jgi:hypothetical protein